MKVVGVWTIKPKRSTELCVNLDTSPSSAPLPFLFRGGFPLLKFTTEKISGTNLFKPLYWRTWLGWDLHPAPWAAAMGGGAPAPRASERYSARKKLRALWLSRRHLQASRGKPEVTRNGCSWLRRNTQKKQQQPNVHGFECDSCGFEAPNLTSRIQALVLD